MRKKLICNDVHAKLNIVYYANSIRPLREHLLGFIHICNSNTHYNCYIITNQKSYASVSREIGIKSSSNITVVLETNFINQLKILLSANIILGSPIGFCKQVLRIILLLNKSTIGVKLRAGKVTKPSGFFHKNKTYITNVLKEYLSHKLFKSYTLVTDFLDKYYCIAAYGSCHEALIIHPSPKLMHMREAFSHSSKKTKLLFAPTHRARGEHSPIDDFIVSKNTQAELSRCGWSIAYSCHEHGFISSQLKDANIEIFTGKWDEIRIVITDYSSIGADFTKATGCPTIYFLPKDDKFLKDNNLPQFFKLEVDANIHVSTERELLAALSDLSKNNLPFQDSVEVVSFEPTLYFENLIAKVNQ